MIAHLRGTLLSSGEAIVLEVGGIGFALQVSARTAQKLPSPGSEVCLYTWLQVRQEGLSLYGFLEPEERELFLLLQEVNGLGPRAALNLLSTFSWKRLADVVRRGDVSALVRVPGIGTKLAQRLVLELKDKLWRRIPGIQQGGTALPVEEAVAALTALGFSAVEAEAVLARARQALGEQGTTAELVAYSLKLLGQQGGS